LDAGFSYLEVKLKDRRSIPVEKRLKVDFHQSRMDADSQDFVNESYHELYGEAFSASLAAVINMQ
jgi:hypothetical protein